MGPLHEVCFCPFGAIQYFGFSKFTSGREGIRYMFSLILKSSMYLPPIEIKLHVMVNFVVPSGGHS